jgi:hypothetical protein
VSHSPLASLDTVRTEFYLSVSGLNAVPVVTVNDQPAEEVDLAGSIFLRIYELPLLPGDSVFLRMSYTLPDGASDTARAEAALPGPFGIVAPDTTQPFELPLGTDFTASWTRAEGAACYRGILQLSCGDLDTTEWGEIFGVIYFSETLDTLLTDTTVTFEGARMFWNLTAFEEADEIFAAFRVMAQSGPWQAGEPGNVTGGGEGFFYARTSTRELYIQVVVPGAIPQDFPNRR